MIPRLEVDLADSLLFLGPAGAQEVLEPGDLTLIDPPLTCSGRFWANSKSLVFKHHGACWKPESARRTALA